MKVLPLLAIPSPRDLIEFHNAIEKVTDIDKLWVKYCPSPITYPRIRQEFLSKANSKYTHLIICPDDLIIDRQKLQYLIDDYQNLLLKEEQNTTVISGYCNVDDSDHSHEANICMEYVTPRRQGRRYNWVKMTSIDSIKGQIERARKDKRGLEDRMQAGQVKITHEDEQNPNEFNKQFLLNVKFAGFGMVMIPRSILKYADLRNDAVGYPVKKYQGCCEDVMLCHQVLEKGHQIYVDVRAQFQHLKLNDRDTRRILMAKETEKLTPYLKYEYHDSHGKKTVSKEVEIKDPELENHTKSEHYIYGS